MSQVRKQTNRYMYHSFPRRKRPQEGNEKGLEILSLILKHGLLLTPEMETWRDRKMPPSPPEEYTVVSKRCCFTEIAENELARHAEYFGQFSLEFETRVLCDLGALPVFYVPRTTDSHGYGPGAAIVTQLAHVQELLERVTAFRQFANSVGGQHPMAPLLVARSDDGGMVIGPPDGQTLVIPPALIARASSVNPFFKFEVPPGVTPFGMSAGTLMTLFNILHWGIHQPDILTGTVKALGSLFYSTERVDDPFLSHYQQREWRLIGGLKKDGVEINRPVPPDLRRALIDLDSAFFERVLEFRTGPSALIDQCELLAETVLGGHISRHIRRIIVPASSIGPVRDLLRDHPEIKVASGEELSQ